MLRIVALIALCLILAACGSMTENRIQCSMDGRSASIISQWGAFGIATKIADLDAARICAREIPLAVPGAALPVLL